MRSRARVFGRRSYQSFIPNLRPWFGLFLVISLISLWAACGGGSPEARLLANVTSGAAPVTVSFTNSSKNADEFQWDFGDGTRLTTNSQDQAVTHMYTQAGPHTVTLTAVKKGEPPQTSSATITITVEPGALHQVTIELSKPNLDATGEQQFTATATDEFGNPIPGLTFSFKVDEKVGEIDQEGKFTAGSEVGTFEDAVTVEVSQGSITRIATADAVTVAGPLDRVIIQPPSTTLGVTQQQQFSATALDRFGNAIPGLSYFFRSDARAGHIDSEGKFTAARTVGSYESGVTVEVALGTVTRTAAVPIRLTPGPIEQVNLEPAEASLEVTGVHKFTAAAFDRFGNPISDAEHVFGSDVQAGRIDGEGNYTAGTRAGTYREGVTVEVSQGEINWRSTAQVTLLPGPLHQVNVEPAGLAIEVSRTHRFAASAEDRYGNPISGLEYSYISDALAGSVDIQGLFTASTRAGTYPAGLTVEVTQGPLTRSASVKVTVEPGPLHQVRLEPTEPVFTVGGEQQFSFRALDRFDNPIPGLAVTFRSDDQAGQMDDQGTFTAGTRAGTYQEGVTVEVSQATVTAAAGAKVTLRPGTLERVLLSPAEATLDIGERLEYDAQATDAYGNPIPGVVMRWQGAEGVGELTQAGVLTAGSLAGGFEQGVKVTAVLGSVSTGASSSVTINPGALHAVSIHPNLEVAAGATRGLAAVATDLHGNVIREVPVTWSVLDPDVGFIAAEDLEIPPSLERLEGKDGEGFRQVLVHRLTAGEVAGRFERAIEARATQGSLARTSIANVTITPNRMAQVVIAPNPANIGKGMAQQFVAAAADQFGNRIPGLVFTWSVEGGGGEIDAEGFFTAGTEPGNYANAVNATTTQEDITATATTSVTVEPERIAFESDQKDDQFDIYVMNGDGTDVSRRTSNGASGPSWAYDGRRVLYDSSGVILLMSDDGTWKFTVVSEDYQVSQPDWSPDGAKIVFHCLPDDKEELCVADVDGGNVTQLTNNSAGDSRPDWSPDGQKIAFVSDRDGNEEIYVMDPDGTTQKRLTIAGGGGIQGVDTAPSWSPDGTEILFQSGRSGVEWGIYIMNSDGTNVRQLTPTTTFSSECPSWSPDGAKIVFHSLRDSDKPEIYIMDRDGGNVVRLTINTATDRCPRWAPHKRGVDVNGASVVIPHDATLTPATVQQVTANARGAVVRVETDLGSGSGIIIEPDGLVLTNNHVIRDAAEITVFLDDGTGHTGRVHGRDLVRDVALLKIDATQLPTLELGDLSRVSLGQQVVVLGYPLGLRVFTVTGGFVSSTAKDRGRNVIWVQTDSAVNPGNSGGPLLTLQGRVIGVVAAKFVSLAIEGVGFAISSNTIDLYLERLKAWEVIF